ncbi:MAG: ABC transporter ATP-binding protein [Candidatus Nanohaloarchaea archaeon]|nr:ABC transporter ATP-binding protein [Candidatus Nanohaloarchaea archaeon]
MAAVETRNLHKDYGDTHALKGVDLTIEEGDFFGLIGPNGAGKTTFINILVGLVEKTRGTAEVFGHDVDEEYQEARDRIGISPQEEDIDPFFPIKEVLVSKAGYHGVPLAEAEERAERLLKKFGIYDKKDVICRKLSGGMKRRFMLARSLVTDPDLLILDEPTAGVDVELRRELWQVMEEMNDNGRTILLTTHYIEEVEQLCEKVAILNQGELLETNSPANFLSKIPDTIEILVEDPEIEVDLGGVEVEKEDGKLVFKCKDSSEELPDIIDSLKEAGARIQRINTHKTSLEEAFLELTRGER